MEIGSITEYIDVAQVVLYIFWGFFAGLVLYLHREGKREGYPLESEISDRVTVVGFPAPPEPKTFLMADGTSITVPRQDPPETLNAEPMERATGAPIVPLGDPMVDGIGPAASSARADHPDMTLDGRPKIVPLRIDDSVELSPRDPDLRGLTVVGADG